MTGQVFKMELDGTVVGKFGKPGKEQGEFSTVHGFDCRNENVIYTRKSSSGAPRNSSCIRPPLRGASK